MTYEEKLIKETMNFCAAVATNGISVDNRLYGKDALQVLIQSPETVSKYILEHLNETDDYFHGDVAKPYKLRHAS